MQIASNHGYLWLNVTANNTVTRQMQSGTISQTGLFSGDPKKNDPHISVLAGFLRSGWGKVWGKNNLDLKAFDGHWARGKSAVFYQTKRI
jgi:hypothetical protein